MSDSSSDSVKTAGTHTDKNVNTDRRDRKPGGRVSTVLNQNKLKIPPFSPDDPDIWFALLEGQFAVLNITEDAQKFNSVITHLDLVHAKAVKDIIISPPPLLKYDKIKTELIKRLSASHENKVRQLLTHEELGDRKPSQFLRHLQDLAGPKVPDDFIKSIWTNRLPKNIQTVLASQSSQSLDQLTELADRISEIILPSNVTSTSSSAVSAHASSEIAELKKMVEKLTLKLEEHTRAETCGINRRARSQKRQFSSKPRSRSNSSYRKYPVCWYHVKHGDNAHRCTKPCDYKKAENIPGSR